MDEFFKTVLGSFDKFALLVPILVAVTLVANAVTRILRIPGLTGDPIPVSHRVAIIGLPGSGKTTLITALFELIQRGADIPNVRLHGLKTIETVNRYVANLNAGEKIGPTKENDTFVFRFSYLKRKFWLARSFDVEIADFPGEFSEQISNNPFVDIDAPSEEPKATSKTIAAEDLQFTLFHKEFFSWIASSREYLFLINLAAVYSDENVRRSVADIIARVRTSWQIIEDSASERGIGSARNRPVCIVFTKVDSILPLVMGKNSLDSLLQDQDNPERQRNTDQLSPMASLKKAIEEAGNTNNLAGVRKQQVDMLNQIKFENDYIFSDLISFFKNRTALVEIVYSSMVITDPKGGRLGMRKLLAMVLP